MTSPVPPPLPPSPPPSLPPPVPPATAPSGAAPPLGRAGCLAGSLAAAPFFLLALGCLVLAVVAFSDSTPRPRPRPPITTGSTPQTGSLPGTGGDEDHTEGSTGLPTTDPAAESPARRLALPPAPPAVGTTRGAARAHG